MRPDQALNRLSTFIAGTFAVDQIQYDDHVMIVSLNFARQLFEYDDNQATALELALVRAESFDKVKRQIIETLGDDYIVLDRYEQQADFFRISKIEKMLTLLLLGFILLIATFNIIGSLSMLMIDKQEDSRTLLNLGATPALIRRIFLLEGWLISLLGAAAGLVLGLVVCLIQQEFGILKLGNGTDYVLSAYPVEVQGMDILGSLFLDKSIQIAYVPAHKNIRNRNIPSENTGYPGTQDNGGNGCKTHGKQIAVHTDTICL